MNISGGGGGGVGAVSSGMMMMRSPFTVSQWQELEHQALIFKYMMAGLPVPPDLVIPIQKSFDSISHTLFHHPAMGYCSFYGKKVDPEPGRCRRTDGKKWRCSKDAYPDSKYCERHMHRGRNRSRKPVESQTMSQSSSTVTSLTATGGSGVTGSFQSLPLHQTSSSVTNQSHYIDSIPYGIPSKDYRYNFESPKQEVDRGVQMDSSVENPWPLMPSRVSLYPQSKSSDNCYPQQSFFGSGEAVKEEGLPLRPFFDEWPKARESWSGLDDDRTNQTSFSPTQLSMSIPMASSTTSSRSPHAN